LAFLIGSIDRSFDSIDDFIGSIDRSFD